MFIVMSVYFMYTLEREFKNAWLLSMGKNPMIF